MGYGATLGLLFAATWGLIAILVWIRRRLPGDYTPFKVGAGVGLTIVAQWHLATLTDERLLLLFVPFAVSGGAIGIWQGLEWAVRQWQRHERRLAVMERRSREQ